MRMMHNNRRWGLTEVESAEKLAKMLTRNSQTLCSAFFVEGHDKYVFLNDATSEDGALEMAVVMRHPSGSYVQVESITFSWCNPTEALAYIEDALAGKFDANECARPVAPRIDPPKTHQGCRLCS